jgi:threonyl-tRNA synthetase
MQTKEAYEQSHLYKLRHSTAHLMAQAILELYPGTKLSIGPPIDNGFYYDVDPSEPIKEEDLQKIEQRMKELAKVKMPIECRVALNRTDAQRIIYEEAVDKPEEAEYKLQLLEAIPEGEDITFYEQKGEDKKGVEHKFIDLCAGPHVENTGELKHFKLMSVAGAYWRGDVKNKQLTRIYGTAFESKDELQQYLHFLEEAKKRDHKVLGRELGLFMFSPDVGTGLPLYLPKGAVLRDAMVKFLSGEQMQKGYTPVITPHIANKRLFEKSGHIPTYQDKMFPMLEDPEKDTFVLKPMNCPLHIEIYKSALRSYRDLPVRLVEFGTVHRYEQSGEVNGMLRCRGFTQDDAHIFCRPDQLVDEFKGVVDLMMTVLKKLGLEEFRARVGTRASEGEKYIGHDENWEHAEKAIITACNEMGLEIDISEGDAAFYGPKLDLVVKDALRRDWQMGTVQVDYNLPERFDLEYVGEDSKPHRPIMLHRAPFGSLERMIGLLTEHYAGAFPLWLSPVQVAVLPIADRHNPYAYAIAQSLQGFAKPFTPVEDAMDFTPIEVQSPTQLRVEVDDRRETLGKKIRENQRQKMPYMLIVGDKDIENNTVGVRDRNGDLGAMSLGEFIDKINGELNA